MIEQCVSTIRQRPVSTMTSEVMLVSSKKDPCVWLVPGGGLEPGEDTVTAARREAWEEAGIQGHIARYLGLFEVGGDSGSAWKRHFFIWLATVPYRVPICNS
ncbi:hypothetical protein OTU49_004659 [Cherax quadricarinatus]|uniref:Nudix hydrolase domain-containing protein n=1 Tax=Cherax quadricarinatus TaxID=27406 RepID=A0AAW0XC27_CHEQU